MIRWLVLISLLILTGQTVWSDEQLTEQHRFDPDGRCDRYRYFAQTSNDFPFFQPMRERGFGRHSGRDDGLAKQRKHLEQLRLLKLLELLDLSEDQELEFITAFSAMRRKLRNLERDKSDLMILLAEGLRERTLSDSEVYDLIDNIVQTDKQKIGEIAEFRKKAREILTAEQLGRLIVFNDRFEYELLERVRAFHERHPGGRGAGTGNPDISGDYIENDRVE
ncbi:MAG: hypothetical protein U9R56_04015 [candidate division Zixibacteria bacterium]|nr:hypothetical protein [candidate division Zixibacteria bacterium]